MSNGDKLGPNDQEPTMSEDQITNAVRGQLNGEGRSHDNLNGEHYEEFGPEMTMAQQTEYKHQITFDLNAPDKNTETLLAAIANATPYQLCPKCHGDGHLGRYNSPWLSSSTHPLCDVCNGSKIIPMFKA